MQPATMEPKWSTMAGLYPYFVPVVLLGAIYLPHLAGDYFWDDLHLVRDHPLLHASNGWYRVFATELLEGAGKEKTQFYHPVPLLTLWLQFRVSDAFAWLRFGDVVIHAGVVVLFAEVLRRFGLRKPTIALTASAFAVHPLDVEPVLLVCGRHDTLGVVFLLGALVLGPLGQPPPDSRRAELLRALGVGLLVMLAICSKEACAGGIPMLALAAWLAPGAPRDRLARLVRCTPPFAGLALALLVRRALAISGHSDQLFAPVATHALNYGTILFEYARYALLFRNGTVTRVFEPLPMIAAIAVIGLAAVLVGIAVRAVHRRGEVAAWTTDRRVLLGLVWFLVSLGPHILSLPVIGMWGNRYGYWPTLGLLLAEASLVEAILVERDVRLRNGVVGAFALIVGLVTIATTRIARTYQNGVTVFGADVEREPRNPLAHYHLGVEIERDAGCEAALPHFQTAVEISPDYTRATHNVAGCLVRLRRFDEALDPAKKAVIGSGGSIGSIKNLVLAQWGSGHRAEARAVLKRGRVMYPASDVLRELDAELRR